MEIKNITTALEIVSLILKNWDENGKIDEMERTVVLKKLKEIGVVVGELSMKPIANTRPDGEELPSLFAQPAATVATSAEKPRPESPVSVPVVEEKPTIETDSPMEEAAGGVESDVVAEAQPEEPELQPESELPTIDDKESETPASVPAEATVPTFEEPANIMSPSAEKSEPSITAIPTAPDEPRIEEVEELGDNIDFELIPDTSLEQESNYEILEGEFDLEPAENLDFEFVADDDDAEGQSEQPSESAAPVVENRPAEAVAAMQQSVVVAAEAGAPAVQKSESAEEERMPQFNRHHKLDRKTINRLYGDDDMPIVNEKPAEVKRDEEERPIFTDTTIYSNEEDGAEDDEFTVVESDDKGGMVGLDGDGDTIVLGEVLNAGRKVLGDSYATEREDVISTYASSKVRSLRSVLGVNDMFLVARDLFGGNVKACEAALDKLDQMQNIDDALLYIHDNFNWDRHREGTQRVMDALMRKLL